MANKHGNDKCKSLLAAYHLTGADYTSKVGTKRSALLADPTKYLGNFTEGKILLEKPIIIYE